MSTFPNQGCNFARYNAAGSNQTKTGAGIFFGLTINTGAAGATVAIYDGTSASGIPMGNYSAAAPQGFLAPMVGRAFKTGLFVVVTGTPDVTIDFF